MSQPWPYMSAKGGFSGPTYEVETMMSDATVWVAYKSFATLDVAMGVMLATGWVFVTTAGGEEYWVTNREIA